MKQFMKTIILIMILTIIILYSYSLLQHKISGNDMSEFYSFLNGKQSSSQSEGSFIKKICEQWKDIFNQDTKKGKKVEKEKAKSEDDLPSEYRAVWLSYQEFNAYRNSVTKNNRSSFRKFFDSVLKRCKELNLNTIIVQVRPYGDALYPSKYFPWAACISGSQGKDPGYDPLKIMVDEAHDAGIRIEAWINPYRISSGNLIHALYKENPARTWAASSEKNRNVLEYEEALYYNPSSEDVRNLIVRGVKEIIDTYDVDGIHMDDYFYPSFTEDTVDSAFDAPEYEKYLKQKSDSPLSIAEWRRENINRLVSSIYDVVHQNGTDITFGISPAGNLDNLRSPLEYYVDIDTWMSEDGYVDYIMPQIYWGFTNTQAPFEEILKDWCTLSNNSTADLYIGLQLYRLGTEDKSQSDYDELQDSDYLKNQISVIESNKQTKGFCLFSYQYVSSQKDSYQFDCMEFSEERRKILLKNVQCMIE